MCFSRLSHKLKSYVEPGWCVSTLFSHARPDKPDVVPCFTDSILAAVLDVAGEMTEASTTNATYFFSLAFQQDAMEEPAPQILSTASLLSVKARGNDWAFLEARREGMLKAMTRSSLVLAILLLVQSAYLTQSFLAGDLAIPGLREVLIHRVTCSGALLLTLVAVASLGLVQCFSASARSVERCIAFMVPVIIFAVPHIDYHYVLRMYRLAEDFFMSPDNPDCYNYSSDSRLMLSWISLLTAAHFFLNVRWFMLIPTQLAGVLTYVVCAVLGSPEGVFNVPMNLALFGGVTALASLAKRQLENHERQQRLQLISERVARFESDFKLEQAQSSMSSGRSSPNRRAADLQSMVTDTTGQTGFTQFVFDMKTDCREQLEHMVALGYQEHWLIEARQLSFNPKNLIGRGNYGVILAGDLLGMPVAVKLPLANASLSLPDLANELRFLRRVRHPHIVAFQGACILPHAEVLFLVEELVNGTSLQSLLPGSLELNPLEKHAVLLGILRALRYLHGLVPSVAHGDLKPSNVLVLERDRSPKLIDFGLSRIRHSHSRQLGGTPRYMAPEVLTKTIQMAKADKADMFSFGRVIFFVLAAANPLQGLSVQDVVSQAERNQVPDLQWPPSPVPYFEHAKRLVDSCLRPSPDERPNAESAELALRAWLDADSPDGHDGVHLREIISHDRTEVDPETRLVTSCAAAAKLYLAQKNQI
ncbi:unnamed protein product [Symbiodinium sp. CCMP2456]|nr:unnamed protein product [Symbiodinium sp. CCMP2456]